MADRLVQEDPGVARAQHDLHRAGGCFDGVQHADREARGLATVLFGALARAREELHAEAARAARPPALPLLPFLGDGGDTEPDHRLLIARQVSVRGDDQDLAPFLRQRRLDADDARVVGTRRRVRLPEQRDLVDPRARERRLEDPVAIGQRHRAHGDRPRRRAAGGDLRRGARRLGHARFVELLGVRVAGGVTTQHADAQSQRHAAPDGADAAILEDVVRARAVLEVKVGVIAARRQRGRQQPFGQRGIDRVQRRQGHRRSGGHRRASGARPASDPSVPSIASAAWRICSSLPPSQTRPTAPNVTISSMRMSARFSASLAARAA